MADMDELYGDASSAEPDVATAVSGGKEIKMEDESDIVSPVGRDT